MNEMTVGHGDESALNDALPREHGPRRQTSGISGWLISAGFHLLMLLIMYGIYWAVKAPSQELPPVRLTMLAPPEKPKDQKHPDPALLKKEVTLTSVPEAEVESPVVITDPDPVTSTEDNTESTQPKGREEAVATAEDGGVGVMNITGPGGGASGPWGTRMGHGLTTGHGPYGAPHETLAVVDEALRWFRKHQSPNGMWDAVNYYTNCADGQKCEPGAEAHGSAASYDVAMTSYALLCYLGKGYDHCTPNIYRSVVKRGLDYLLSVQKADGYFGERNYENAIATMVLCEAYGMTNDQALHDPALRAVHQILAHENLAGAGAGGADGGSSSSATTALGWDYVGPSSRNDASVTGWNVMALKDALSANLIGIDALNGPKHWLEVVWKKQNPQWTSINPYKDESRFPYTYQTESGAMEISAAPAALLPGPNDHDLTCVGAVCAVFLGRHDGDPMLDSMTNYLVNHYIPTSWPTNAYYLYYNTMTMFQVGGAKWMRWNDAVKNLLVKSQRHDAGCFKGSWDWSGGSFIGGETGRVLTTAYATLCLEVYYRKGREQR